MLWIGRLNIVKIAITKSIYRINKILIRMLKYGSKKMPKTQRIYEK